MRTELLFAATALPVSLGEMRDFLKISQNDEDALLASLLRAGGEACENYLGRKLLSQQWQITLNGWHDEIVTLPLSPILSLDKIEVWAETQFVTMAAADYLLDRSSYQARILPGEGIIWSEPSRDIDGIRITLTAGFGVGQNDIPHDLRLGIMNWVAGRYDGDDAAIRAAEKLWQPYRRMIL